MGEIERYDVSEEWAHSGIIKAGDFCFLGYDGLSVQRCLEYPCHGENHQGKGRCCRIPWIRGWKYANYYKTTG